MSSETVVVQLLQNIHNMRILVKFPSRERPKQFIENLKKCIELSVMPQTQYLISLDNTDPNHEYYTSFISELNNGNITVVAGYSKNKVHAINRDVTDYKGEWEILMVVSDDQIPQMIGWDKILAGEMQERFPDTDGVLYHNDGFTKLNTMCILGRKYFQRFNYIYNPAYISLWSDNEFMEVSRILNKEAYFEEVLFKHEHFSNVPSVKQDPLMRKNESFYYKDKATFTARKNMNYGI